MLIQALGGILGYSLDIKKTFNHGKYKAKYIDDTKIDKNNIVTACESASINAYLEENLYNLVYQKKQGFYLWNTNFSLFYNKTLNEKIDLGFTAKPSKKSLYFIFNNALKTDKRTISTNNLYTITLEKKFEGAVKNNYYLYLIQKNE